MSRQRIIIDTDPGVDDAIAIWLALALASPELDVLGITTVAGNVPVEATVRNACNIIGLAGRADVPVYGGAPRPLVREQVFGKYAHIGAFSSDLVPHGDIRPQQEHAVEFLVRTAKRAAQENDPVTICAIGPLTNLALALRFHPDVARGIKQIVFMGGAFTALGNRVPWADFNVYADPHAAQIVFSSGVPLTMMPLDVTFQALIQPEQVAELERRCGSPGAAIAALLRAFDRNDVERLGREGGPIHDATVISWLLEPSLFGGVPAYVAANVSGDMAGYVMADFYRKLGKPANAQVIRTIDEAGFLALLAGRLSRYGAGKTDGGERI